jgi:putative transposase
VWKSKGKQMVLEALAERRSKAEVGAAFGISRKSVYKWLERCRAQGREGLGDRWRAPHHVARAITERGAQEIVRLRLEQPLEGPLKIAAKLKALHPQWENTGAQHDR